MQKAQRHGILHETIRQIGFADDAKNICLISPICPKYISSSIRYWQKIPKNLARSEKNPYLCSQMLKSMRLYKQNK